MIKNVNPFLYFFALFTTIVISCKKNSGPAVWPLDTDLVKYYNYKPGTYWIYKDSLSGRIDSFATISNDSGFALGGKIQSIFSIENVDYISIVVNDYDKNNTNSIPAQWTWTLMRSVVVLNMPDFFFPFFYYPYSSGGWESFQSGENTADQYLASDTTASYTINGSVYTKISVIYHYDTLKNTNPYHFDQYYLNDSIGIIKMKLYHPLDSINFTWELQRCNIVR